MSNRDPWLLRCALAGMNRLGQDCALCGAGSGPQILCEACAASLPTLPEHCPRCALPAPRGAVCGTCLANPPHFDATSALWLYEFPCDRLVQALKYRAWLGLAPFFAQRLASLALGGTDLLIAMPLHPDRLAQRGFNQALEVARRLARHGGLALEPRGATRILNTPPQTELPYEERAKNIQGAFACRLDLSGKTVAVVDDVMTTGATLNELARILKKAGATAVRNLVIARSVLR
jgi:ComF family protein